MGCGPSSEATAKASQVVVTAEKGNVMNNGKPVEKYLESFTILLIGAGDAGKSSAFDVYAIQRVAKTNNRHSLA
jgi:hypothetical protein